MRLIGSGVALAAAAGFYLLGGNRLDEQQVRDFYQRAEQAMLALDDEMLCSKLAEDFQQTITNAGEADEVPATADKAGYCDNTRQTMAQLRHVRDTMAGRAPMHYSQTVESVTVAPDRRSAQVQMRATLELPGMRLTSHSHDTVVRRRWKLYDLRSDAVIRVEPASR
ncbi:MAG: nuclear transport factor 2 family protein [Stenotrophomonas sp.]